MSGGVCHIVSPLEANGTRPVVQCCTKAPLRPGQAYAALATAAMHRGFRVLKACGKGQVGMAPQIQGLYNPAYEHDSCGVAMVADIHGRRSRDIVDKAITALLNLEHRGAQGAEPNTGDGAGILLQVPDAFLREVVDFDLPRGRLLRHRHRLPPAVVPGRRRGVRVRREDRRGRGSRRARLARRADRRFVPRCARPRRDADVPPGVHRLGRREGSSARHGPGTPRLRRAQAGRTRARHQGPGPGRPRPGNRLLPKPFRPDVRLQGHADHAAAARRSTSTCRTTG